MLLDRLRASAYVLTAGVAVSVGACAPAATSAPAAPVAALVARAVAVTPVPGAATDHVVVISIDGLRPDAIAKFDATTIERLMQEGSYALNAKTIMPSRTLPSHTSMLTGEEPEAHGITWNRNKGDVHGHAAVPTVFAQARERGLHTAAFFSKGKFNHLEVPNTLDHSEAPEGNDSWSAGRTVANVERYLERAKPNLMFVHIGEPDYAGHKFSWMSWFYGRAVRKADWAVARVLEASDRAFGEGNYAVILTADHGGHGWTHGSEDPRDVTIPWVAWGQGVRAGTVLPDGIRTMDTAATALWLLGIPALGVGEVVQTALSPAPAAPLWFAVGERAAAASEAAAQ